jgi:hypothetical protein
MQLLILLALVLALQCSVILAADKSKPHGHKGVLEAYTGKPLPCKPTGEQSKKLDKGEAVMVTERVGGKGGRGVVIQDVNSPPNICMDKIRDLPKYPKMVPHVKSIEIYETKKSMTGVVKVGAKYNIGLMGMGFGYFLMHTYNPMYNTLTWTLDYNKNSDFDDNVGHWQVMAHPSKKGWTRVLYSTKVKLFPWIPEFIVKFLTSKALVESTSWVKRESELEAAKQAKSAKSVFPDFKAPSWLGIKGGAINQDNQQKQKDQHPLHAATLGLKLRMPFGKAF